VAVRNADSVLPKLFSGEKDLAKPRLTFVVAFVRAGFFRLKIFAKKIIMEML